MRYKKTKQSETRKWSVLSSRKECDVQRKENGQKVNIHKK